MRPFTRTEYLRACARAVAVAPMYLARPYLERSRYRAYQSLRIARLIRHAYDNTAFYRRKYHAAGVSPRDFRELSDLTRFPTTSKDELIAAIRARELGPARDARIDSVSSGSSGKVIVVGHDVRDTHAYAVGRYRILNITGCLRPWDTTFYVYTSRFPARSLFGLYPSCFVSTLNDLDDTIRRLSETKPKVLCIYPSRLFEMANAIDPVAAREIGLALVSVNSETSSAEQRAAMAEHFGCPVLDEYSTEELGWAAAECAFTRRHVWEDMVYLEVLDGNRDRSLPPGELGEIVGTNLHNFATPFIRYRQGDLGAIRDDACPCGRTFRVLHDLVGRKNDAFHFDAASLSPAYLLDSIYSLLLEHRLPIVDFCLVQDSRDQVTFQFLASPPRLATPDLDRAIERLLTARLPDGVTVRAQATAQMYKTATGKRNPIVSRVPAPRDPTHRGHATTGL